MDNTRKHKRSKLCEAKDETVNLILNSLVN